MTPARTCPDFASLPDDIKGRIETLIAPVDPELWVNAPIAALGDRTFLETLNGDDGAAEIARYFADVEAFERPHRLASAQDLSTVFRFDATDLESNRAGRLSAAQRRRLWQVELWRLAGTLLSLAAGVAFSLTIGVGWMHTTTWRGAVAGLALVLVGVLLGVWSYEAWLDLASGRVLTVEGDLRTTEKVSSGRYGPYFHYLLDVGGKTFEVSKREWERVGEARMRVYYLPRTNKLLSLEPSGGAAVAEGLGFEPRIGLHQ